MLRDFGQDDAAAVHDYASDPETVRYMSWGPNSETDTADFIQRTLASQQLEPRLLWGLAVVRRSDDQLIGGCSIRICGNEDAEIGYTLARSIWGQGYGTETAQALVAVAFEQLGLHRIWATCSTENVASARVLEKAGMRREGHLRQHLRRQGGWTDSYLYAILKSER